MTRRVVMPGSDGRPAATTVLDITDPLVQGRTVRGVKELLDPTKWPQLHPRWCSMDPVDGPDASAPQGSRPELRRYREVFAVRSDFKLDTVLEFAWQRLTDGDEDAAESPESLEYWLSPGSPYGDGLVVVDEGSIVVSPVVDGISIRATKRVRFLAPFDGAGLALVADALGYLAAFEEMVCRARQLRRAPERGSP